MRCLNASVASRATTRAPRSRGALIPRCCASDNWRQNAKPFKPGQTYPAKELCSHCGLCDSYYVRWVSEACAFLGEGERNATQQAAAPPPAAAAAAMRPPSPLSCGLWQRRPATQPRRDGNVHTHTHVRVGTRTAPTLKLVALRRRTRDSHLPRLPSCPHTPQGMSKVERLEEQVHGRSRCVCVCARATCACAFRSLRGCVAVTVGGLQALQAARIYVLVQMRQ
jgi:hypothetical protein